MCMRDFVSFKHFLVYYPEYAFIIFLPLDENTLIAIHKTQDIKGIVIMDIIMRCKLI